MVTKAETSSVPGEVSAEMPAVAIIVLNWNNYEDTTECLESLEEVEYPNFEVIVVDNGSTDASGDRLRDEFEWCEFVFSPQNRGFAGGCNLGIRRALRESETPEYILLLNNDITVKREFLNHLVSVAEDQERAAGIGGVIRDLSGEIWFAGGRFVPYLCRGSHIQTIKSDEPYETEFITGAMILLDYGFLSDIGGLNEDYFFGMEDLDLCLTARQQNLKLLIAPEAQAIHDVSSSAGRRSPFKYYNSTRNRLQFASNNLSIGYRIVFYILFAFTRIARGIQWGFSNRFDLVRSVWSGVIDYLVDARFRRPEDFGSE